MNRPSRPGPRAFTSLAAPPRALALLAALVGPASGCDKAATEPAAAPAQPASPTPPAPAPGAAPAPANTDMPEKTDPLPAPASPPAVVAERPLYYDRPLTPADLSGRTLRELTLMRNTIYARVGQSFRKPWLDQHFRRFDWYAPAPTPDLTRLTPTDYENARAIVDHERAIPRAMFESQQKALLAKKAAGPLSPAEDVELELLAVHLGGWTADPELKPEDLSPLADPTQLDALLSANQLATLSLRDLRMLRNTIYARRGRPFRSVLLQEYFGAMEWYTPDEEYTDAKLTPIDRKNVRLVQSVEKASGGPLTDYEHKVEEGWFFAA
ncbi:YARHG domain-containing protein [Nannocystis punicea]|uniref:YARHG domain-containing protein n=1 Tax=Nannocystis punicea TaxID=2995304 RepID=A0ABY7HHI3_9BACT|nr:YARHG domain-containing protein [Nannocystis poenicansa]WAS98334.1 YARHG domain-containing protein [Nannocystis poenicansa]